MKINNIPIAFCVILGNLTICYIIITVLHVFILLNIIQSNLTQILNFKHDFHRDFELFLNNIACADNRRHFRIVSTLKKI